MEAVLDLVAVAYNAPDELDLFLQSIHYVDVPFTFTLIDNNSPDPRVLALFDKWESALQETNSCLMEVRFVRNKDNIRYSRACNQGAALGKAPIIGLLNCDVQFLHKTASGIIEYFNRAGNEKVGAMGPLTYDENGLITHAGIFRQEGGGDGHRAWQYPVDHFRAALIDDRNVPTVSGATYFTRRTAWNELTDCPSYQEAAPGAKGAFLPTEHFYEETFCLDGETSVWTINGPRAIRDVRAGDKVYAWDEETNKIVVDAIVWSGQTGTKETQEVRSHHSTPIVTTPEHKFLTARINKNGCAGELTGWAEVNSEVTHTINAKDLSCIDRNSPPPNVTLDAMKLFGAWLGDGSYNLDRQVVYSIPEGDRVHEAYIKLATSTFVRKTRWSRRGDKYEIEDFEPANVHINGRTFRISTIHGVNWMRGLGFTGKCLDKRIPKWVFTVDAEFQWHFLAGLVDSDGHINAQGGLNFTLANKWLVEDVYFLCVLLGLKPGGIIYQKQPNPFYSDQGTHVEFTESWRFNIQGSELLKTVPTEDPLYRDRLNNARIKSRSGKRNKLIGLPESLTSRNIISVKPAGVRPVYDITTARVGNFFANGTLVHNCSYHLWSHGYNVRYYGQVEMIHSWHRSSPHGSQSLEPAETQFREACAIHGIELDW